jgi:hypothetical protein
MKTNRLPVIFTTSLDRFFLLFVSLISSCILFSLSSCGIYKFNDVGSIDPRVKTVRIGYIQNKARYINPQLAPKFTDKIQQKITSQTKLTRTNKDDAHYIIDGTITNYDPSQTVGINAQQATTNRLTVTLHMTVRKTLDNITEEFDVSRSFDYSASLSLQQAEGQLLDEVVRSLTDEIFNRIFSNW